jgi:hypothetical protein
VFAKAIQLNRENFMIRTKLGHAALAVAMTLILTISMKAQETRPVYLDKSQPIEKRVDDLVRRMTLEEKASQLVNHTRAIPRLNVPEYDLWSEALHGVANNGVATVFPQAVGLAATFNAPLIHQMAKAVALEARVKFNQAKRAGSSGRLFQGLTFFSPNINIVRDPLYATFPQLPGAPRRALRGFMRIQLRAGESKIVRFTLADRDLSHVNEAGVRQVGAGNYRLTIGGGQPGTQAPGATATFVIQGEMQLPR